MVLAELTEKSNGRFAIFENSCSRLPTLHIDMCCYCSFHGVCIAFEKLKWEHAMLCNVT